MKNIKMIKTIGITTLTTAGALLLSSCNTDTAKTIPSSSISFGDNNELNLNRDEVLHLGSANPTAISITVAGAAADDAACLAAMTYKDASDTGISFGTSKNVTGYAAADDNEIIYAPATQCGGKSLTVNVDYQVGSQRYMGSNTLTVPS